MDKATTYSLFNNHELKAAAYHPQMRDVQYDYLIAPLILVLTCVFIWLIAFRMKVIKKIVKGFFLSGYLAAFGNKKVKVAKDFEFLLVLFFIVNTSLFLGNMVGYFDLSLFNTGMPDSLNIFLLLSLAYLVKIYGVQLIGHVFEIQKATNFHINTVLAFHAVSGFILFPILVMLTFVKAISPILFLIAGSLLIIALLVFRIIKGVSFGRNKASISDFYLFLYLCTFELLPIAIIIKLISLRIVG